MTMTTNKFRGWIGVDLDGTLATYDQHHGTHIIGRPVDSMLFRVKQWLDTGVEVRIFTARASDPELLPPLREWLQRVGLSGLTITNRRDYDLLQLWDDRAVQVEFNTGNVLTPKEHITLNANGWIGVELDGTLAHYDKNVNAHSIGEPVAKMHMRLKQWVMAGIDVRLFTARAADPTMKSAIQDWLKQHQLEKMKVTCEKDFMMTQFWDDRAVHVVSNRGDIVAQLESMQPERKYP